MCRVRLVLVLWAGKRVIIGYSRFIGWVLREEIECASKHKSEARALDSDRGVQGGKTQIKVTGRFD
jgi:hypothetical protein